MTGRVHVRVGTIGVLCSIVVASGCGNLVLDGDLAPAGVSGVSVSEDGQVSVELFVCGPGVTDVVVLRDREGLADDEPNPVVQRYRAQQELAGRVSLDLGAPGPAWEPSTSTDVDRARGYLVLGEGPDEETTTTYLRGEVVDELAAGVVHAGVPGGALTEPLTEQEFVRHGRSTCADR